MAGGGEDWKQHPPYHKVLAAAESMIELTSTAEARGRRSKRPIQDSVA